jgi:hypothetical protein
MAYSLNREPWMEPAREFDGRKYFFKAYATSERCTNNLKRWLKEEKGYMYARVVRLVTVNLIYARKTP